MEPEGSLPSSQEAAIGDILSQMNPDSHPTILYLLL
jgi:hypothetical protein